MLASQCRPKLSIEPSRRQPIAMNGAAMRVKSNRAAVAISIEKNTIASNGGLPMNGITVSLVKKIILESIMATTAAFTPCMNR